MQRVLKALHDAYENGATKSRIQQVLKYAKGHCQGLKGHVGIEEHHVFPSYCASNPDIDFSILYEAHEDLHAKQNAMMNALGKSALDRLCGDDDAVIGADTICAILESAIDYDEELMSHLGEEEEIITPMELIGS